MNRRRPAMNGGLMYGDGPLMNAPTSPRDVARR